MATTLNEKIKVGIELDTSGLTTGITKANTSLRGLKNSFGGSQGSANKVSESLEELRDSMESIRNMDAFSILSANIDKVSTHLKVSNEHLGDFKNHLLNSFTNLNPFAKAENGGRDLGSALINIRLAGDSARGAFRHLGLAIKSVITPTVLLAAKILLLVGAVVAFVAQTKMAIQRAQELKQTMADAAKIGLSVEAYQQWGYVLEAVGVEANELSSFIKTLSDEQAQMAEGSEGASKAFEALGLSVNDVINMNQGQLFTETVERLQEVENAVERTKLAYQIFGEDAAHLANVMNMSSEQMRKLINNYNELGGAASQSLVNKSNILSMSLGNLKQAWGGLTNAIAELFMPAITAVVNWLTKAIVIVRMFIQTIFGLDSSPASKTATKMASGMGAYTAATNSATKAVEKLKRAQMGFDELNVLPGNDSSGSSGSGDADLGAAGAGFPGGSFELPDTESLGLDKWKTWLDEYKTVIQDILTWGLIASGMLIAVTCFMGGNWIGAIGGLALAGIGLSIGSAEGSTFDRFSQKLETTSGFIKGVIDFIILLFKSVWEYIVGVIKGIIESVDEVVGYIKKAFKEMLKGITDILNGILTMISGWIDLITAVITGDFSGAWEAIKKIFSGAKQFFEGLANLFMAPIKAAKNIVVTVFKNVWTNIKDIFSNWGSFFSGLGKSITKIFKGLGQKIGDTFGGAIKGVINSVLNLIETTVNGFIRQINNAIKFINKIPGVNIKSIGYFSIPRLATGGIVTQSTLANIGENGKEAVLPLENNTQWMDTLADKIAARNGGASKIVLMVDGTELGWASIKGINSITDQTGNLQLKLR